MLSGPLPPPSTYGGYLPLLEGVLALLSHCLYRLSGGIFPTPSKFNLPPYSYYNRRKSFATIDLKSLDSTAFGGCNRGFYLTIPALPHFRGVSSHLSSYPSPSSV